MNRLKILYAISLIGLASCDKIPDGVVEPQIVDYKVKSIAAPTSFTFSQPDSSFVASIQFEDDKNINKVWLSVLTLDKGLTVTERIDMNDDGNTSISGDLTSGDNVFTAKIPMSRKFSTGKYIIEFFVEDLIRLPSENVSKVGLHTFSYDNNQVLSAPVISNLSIANAVSRGESFVFSVQASDQNGLTDIAQVYFKLYRPDGTLVDPQNGLDYFLMVDDGSENYSDATAGDGIYSFRNSFGASSQTGKWRFEFQAKDKSLPAALLSNTIIHEMIVE